MNVYDNITPPLLGVTPEQQMIELMQRLRARADGKWSLVSARLVGQYEAIDACLTTLARLRGENLSGEDLFDISRELDNGII